MDKVFRQLAPVVEPALGFVQKFTQRATVAKLAPYGLKYDDTLADTTALDKALTRLPTEVREARQRRLSRAFDLSLKHKTLPKEMWMTEEEIFDPYVRNMMEKIEEERLEQLNW